VVFPTTNCVNLNFTCGVREMTIMFSGKNKCEADLGWSSINDWCPTYPTLTKCNPDISDPWESVDIVI
jgi:hypothetical protein